MGTPTQRFRRPLTFLGIFMTIRPHLTQLSGELRQALTHEAVRRRAAPAAVLARPAGTLVPLGFTVGAHEARRAQAPMSLLQNTEGTLGRTGQAQQTGSEASVPGRCRHSGTDRGSL